MMATTKLKLCVAAVLLAAVHIQAQGPTPGPDTDDDVEPGITVPPQITMDPGFGGGGGSTESPNVDPDAGTGGGLYDCSKHEDSKGACNSAKSNGKRVCKYDDEAGAGGGPSTGMEKCASYSACDVFEETVCKNNGCKWNAGLCSDDEEGVGEEKQGVCKDFDAVVFACKKIEDKDKCTKTCEWNTMSLNCEKSESYDPNGCDARTAQGDCEQNSCKWQEAYKACERKDGLGDAAPGTGDTEGGGQGANDGEGGDGSGNIGYDLNGCDNIMQQKDCDAAKNDEAQTQRCYWTTETDVTGGTDTGGEDGISNECGMADDETKCKAKKECEWNKEQAMGGIEGGEGGGSCSKIDVCTKQTAKAACEKEDCNWSPAQGDEKATCFAKMGIMTGGSDGDGGEGGNLEDCSTMDTKAKCTDFGETDGGNDALAGMEGMEDEEQNPQCMWVKNQQTSCDAKDDCYIKYNDQASCEKQKSCEWADWDGGECSTTSSGEGEGPNMECGMVADVTKAKCEGTDGCMWKDKSAMECDNFRKCYFTDEKSCDGSTEEKCYWESFSAAEGFCNEGVRPTTQSSTTSSSITTTSTSTSSTTFSCNDAIYGYGAFMCNDRSKCVRSNYKCDGVGSPDCADGSDESEETCGVKKTTTDAPTTAVELETEKPVTQDPSELVCISTGECENDKEKRKAGEREVPYSVSLECRKCVNPGFTEEQLCAKKVTTGCTEEVEPASTGAAATPKPDESTSSPAATTGAAAKDNSCAKDGGDMRDQCMTPEEITNAGATDAKDLVFSTSIKCRMCVTGKTKEELCAAKVTEGCEEEVTEVETRTAEQKKTDEKTTVLRVSSDIEDKDALNIALLDKIRNSGGQIRSAQILAVEIEAVAGSAYDRVIVYSKRFSGMKTDVAKTENLTFAVNGESVTVYNGEVWDVEGPADASGAPKLIPAGGKATSLEGAVAAKKKNEAQGGSKAEMDKAVAEQADTLKKIQDQIDALASKTDAESVEELKALKVKVETAKTDLANAKTAASKAAEDDYTTVTVDPNATPAPVDPDGEMAVGDSEKKDDTITYVIIVIVAVVVLMLGVGLLFVLKGMNGGSAPKHTPQTHQNPTYGQPAAPSNAAYGSSMA